MTAKRDYNRLARAVTCPRCGAPKGERCFGTTRLVKYTHFERRRLAADVRAAKRGV